MKPPFGVSQYTTWTLTFDDDIRLYEKLGISNVEVCEGKLTRGRERRHLEAVTAAGMTVTSVQPRYHSPFANSLRRAPAEPSVRMDLLAASVRLFGRHFPGTTLVVNTGLAPNGDLDTAHRVAIREFKRVAQVAERAGVRLALEPLHPVYMNTDSFISSLAHAERIIDGVNRSNFGLFLDLWHVWEEAEAARRIRRAGKALFGVHISDWRLPRARADRLLPGEGEIPIIPLLRAVRQAGYRGVYTLEVFSDLSLKDSLWKHPARSVTRGRDAFSRIWRKLCD